MSIFFPEFFIGIDNSSEGDCLKLRAVYHPQLTHLVDCVVFASVGKRAAPSMSSGGDLDGDLHLCFAELLLSQSIR